MGGSACVAAAGPVTLLQVGPTNLARLVPVALGRAGLLAPWLRNQLWPKAASLLIVLRLLMLPQ